MMERFFVKLDSADYAAAMQERQAIASGRTIGDAAIRRGNRVTVPKGAVVVVKFNGAFPITYRLAEPLTGTTTGAQSMYIQWKGGTGGYVEFSSPIVTINRPAETINRPAKQPIEP
jgi:hypothetical protein